MRPGFSIPAAVVLLAMIGSPAAQASTVSLIATGIFTAQGSEAFGYDEETGDELILDSFVTPGNQPFPTGSTFTVSFDLDTTIVGDPPIFGSSAGIPFFFDNAVSNLSLDINGVNVINDTLSTGRLTQFVANTGMPFDDRWNINVNPEDPEGAPWGIPTVIVDVEESPGSGSYIPVQVVPDGLYLGLFDSTQTVYDGLSGSDMLIPSLSSFDSTRFSLDWYTECTEFDCPEVEVIYTAIGEITSINAVPIPAAAWLFGSALAGLGVFGRRRKSA